jgi:hypothetical protein
MTRVEANGARAKSGRHSGELFNRFTFRGECDKRRGNLRVSGVRVEQRLEQLFRLLAIEIFATNQARNEFC